MHAKATLSNTTIAETSTFEFVEGNVYFPISSVINHEQTLVPSSKVTQCPWKGEGHYYDLVLEGGERVRDAAWYYPQPYEKAKGIKDHVAFDKSKVHVEKDSGKGGEKHHGGFMHKIKNALH